jgi:hypothetical protein
MSDPRPTDQVPPPAVERAELSSIAAGLEDLTRRVTGMAERHTTDPDRGYAGELYEIERSLLTANRRLAALVRALR